MIIPLMNGCSSRIKQPNSLHLLQTDRVKIKFTKTENKYCMSGDDVLSLNRVMENLRINQDRLIKAIENGK